MPPKGVEKDKLLATTSEQSRRSTLSDNLPPRQALLSDNMGTQIQTTQAQFIERMRLPPIVTYNQSTASPASYANPPHPYSLYDTPDTATTPLFDPLLDSRAGSRAYQALPTRHQLPAPAPYSPAPQSNSLSPRSLETIAGRKRPYEATLQHTEHIGRIPLHVLTPASLESRESVARSVPPPYSAHSSLSNASTPTRTTFTNPAAVPTSTFSRPPSEGSMASNTNRCSLYIRQQPRAARAGPDGKDRRALDPPPILQLLINDFDPDASADIAELKSIFVVHCRLISAQSPRRDLSTLSSVAEDGSKEIQRLLLGTAVSSPLFCQDDPDPETMPEHPTTTTTEPSGPPSPTSRFIQSSSRPPEKKAKKEGDKPTNLPGTFFIFADLSVRKAGEYRLEFSLMKMDPLLMVPGNTLPSLHSVTSNVFKVVNAKDFDQVQPSTKLVKGLLERGAGFPLKLKKGTREGQRRPRRDGSQDDDDDDDDDDADGNG